MAPQNCSCKEACNTTFFSQELSYSGISKHSCQILQDKRQQIEQKYKDATETKYRADPYLFAETMSLLYNYNDVLDKVLFFFNETTKGYELKLVERSLAAIINMAKKDIRDIFLANLTKMEDAYMSSFGKLADTILGFCEPAKNYVKLIMVLVESDGVAFPGNATTQSLVAETQQSLEVLRRPIVALDLSNFEGKSDFTPMKYSKNESCEYIVIPGMITQIADLANLINGIRNYSAFTDPVSLKFRSDWKGSATRRMSILLQNMVSMKICLTEFQNELKDLKYLVKEFSGKKIRTTMRSSFNYDESYDKIDSIKNNVSFFITEYASGRIAKEEIFNVMANTNGFQIIKILGNIFESLFQAYIEPNEFDMKHVLKELKSIYLTVLQEVLKFAEFYSYRSMLFESAARQMKILLSPVPTFDEENIISFPGKSKFVWPETESLNSFANKYARQAISQIIGKYLESLDDPVKYAKDMMTELTQNITYVQDTVQKEATEYKKQLMIDESFMR